MSELFAMAQPSLSAAALKTHNEQFGRRVWRIEIYTLAGVRVGLPGVSQGYDSLLTVPTDYPVCDLLQSPHWVKEVPMQESGTIWEGAEGNIKVAPLGWQPLALILAGGLTVDAQVNLPVGYGSTNDRRIVQAINSAPTDNTFLASERQKWLECMEHFELNCIAYTPGIKASDGELVERITHGYYLAFPPNNYQATIWWILKPMHIFLATKSKGEKGERTIFSEITQRAKETVQLIQKSLLYETVAEMALWERETKQGVLDSASHIPTPREVPKKELSKRLWLTDVGEYLPKEVTTTLCGLHRAHIRPYVISKQHKEALWREFNKLLLGTCSAVKEDGTAAPLAQGNQPIATL